MVARSAYAQLGYSPLLLAGTVLGMVADLSRRAGAGARSAPALARWLGAGGLGR